MKGFVTKSIVILAFFIAPLAYSQDTSPRALVHLLDYLGQDYSGAVSNGKVISYSEYQEQKEFSESAVKIAKNLKDLTDPKILGNVEKLRELILNKAPVGEVSTLAQLIKNQVIKVTGMTVSPDHWPSLSHGQMLYSQTCVTCHGPKGDGLGPAAQSLKPPPINFFDAEKMDKLSPFKAFNAIRIGVPGTAMTAQTQFSDKDVWDLAFYVLSLRHLKELPTQKEKLEKSFSNYSKKLTLENVSVLSDEEIKAKEGTAALATVRTHSGDDDSQDALRVAKSLLGQSLRSYEEGHYEDSKSKALVAYLEGIEPVEPRLRASDPALTSELENRMAQVRSAIEGRQPLKFLENAVDAANQEIDLAELLLNQKAPSSSVTFLIAAAILLREGFEAVLIIIALLGVIRATGSNSAKRWVHSGWIAALGVGALLWFFSGWVMMVSGAQRELTEGITSLLAVVVLLYMGFWLHRTTEIGRWKKFLDGKVKTALQGNRLFGLAAISFMAVFREAFETVLFLRALWLEGGMSTKWAMAAGVFGSLILVIVLAWLILRFTAKVPIRKLFSFSALLMILLAVILIGKGVHSLQEVGWVSVGASPLNFRSDLFGFYPTLETTIGQVLVLLLALILWLSETRPHRRAASKA